MKVYEVAIDFNLLVSHVILSDVTDQWVREEKLKSILDE